MAEDMLVRNLAPRTIDSYTYHVDRFARHFGKLPEDLGPEQIREFQLWLIQVNQSSWSQFNQAVCALRFLYTVTVMGIPMRIVGQGAQQLRGPTGLNTSYTTGSVTLGGGEAVDVILDTTGVAPGTYFLHTTNLNFLSNNDEDFGGMMTEIAVN